MPSSGIDPALVREAFDRAIQTHDEAHERFFLARLLDLKFEYPADACEVAFDVRPFLLNASGKLHGGIVCLVLDSCMGHLLHHQGASAVTLEMKVQFLEAVTEGALRARATVLKQGRRVTFLGCELVDVNRRLIAFATATWRAVR